jgi:hypothetical protein
MIGQPQDGSVNQLRGKPRSAKRTSENSPAIHRRETSIFNFSESAKRTKEFVPEDDSNTLSPVSRVLENFSHRVPSTKVLG